MPFTELYDILGVTPTATPEELKLGYRRATRACHPDHHPDDLQAATKFTRVTFAYETLSDPNKRAIYDRTGHAEDLPPDLESRQLKEARSRVSALFLSALERVTDPTRENPLSYVYTDIQQSKQMLLTQLEQAMVLRQRFSNIHPRVTLQPGAASKTNILAEAVLERVRELDQRIAGYRNALAIAELSLTALRDFGYIVDTPQPQYSTHPGHQQSGGVSPAGNLFSGRLDINR